MEEVVTQKTAPTVQAGAKAIQTGQKMIKGIKDGVPIALGYFPVSFTFGILATSYGFNWWEATLISMLNLTSAGQFAGLNIMHAGGGLIEMALSQLVINLRYSLMSISLSQKVDQTVRGIYRWALAFGNTDEIFAVASSQQGAISRRYLFGLITLPFFGWTGGTVFGALLGAILPARLEEALGIALYGMFIAIVVPAVKRSRPVLMVVAIAALLSCVFYYIPGLNQISSGFTIIICGVVASAIGAVLFPISDEENNSTTELKTEEQEAGV